MLTNAQTKFFRALQLKKHRDALGLFLAEGPKVVGDLMALMPAATIAATEDFLRAMPRPASDTEIIPVSEAELRRISCLQHPQQVVAIFPKPQQENSTAFPTDALALALDGVQDPGNVGTIIRTADWFGLRHIYCSPDTADAYNPKVVQATMGSLARVHIIYTALPELLSTLPPDFPVYATLLDGDNLYAAPLTPRGLIVMGNEGKGISAAVRQRVSRRLLIPPYPAGADTAESLNVATATAIVCAEFRRRAALD